MSVRLQAAGGLCFELGDALPARVRLDGVDWLGPVEASLAHGGVAWRASRVEAAPISGRDDLGEHVGRTLVCDDAPLPLVLSVRAYAGAPILVFRIEARAAIEGAGSGRYADPAIAWPVLAPALGAAPEGTRSYGHQMAEFALPVSGAPDATGFVLAGHRPPVVWPLCWIAPGGRTLLLAPLDAFHEQVVRVPDPARPVEYVHGEGLVARGAAAAIDGAAAAARAGAEPVRAGWHGDLARVPAGFATEMMLLAASGPREALDAWGAILMRRAGTRRPPRHADPFLAHLSYWTDNGAVYYYRPEPDHTIEETLSRVARELPASGIPIRALQLDSWFYPHETLRAVSAEGTEVVPPTGMMRWEPREDLFPRGFGDLRRITNGLPLAFHSRHFSAKSPYFDDEPAWRDGAYAHPCDPDWTDRFMASVAAWNGATYEQDWLVESFLGVRGLREEPGRARAWQEGMDRSAARHGITLQWCMGTPADWAQTVTLSRVTSVRTSGDYRYLFDNGLNWVWFLHGNAFARALGLAPYKDVFLSHGETGYAHGERWAEAESMLSALSTGPVGLGDRLGFSDRELVLRTCREDGVLVKPDVPLAAIDRCFRANAFLSHEPLLGECFSQHRAGRVVYAVAMNASRAKQPMDVTLPLAELGVPSCEHGVVVWDARARTLRRASVSDALACRLDWQEFSLQVITPVLRREVALVGDASKWACAGDHRIGRFDATDDGMAFDVLGVREERVLLLAWSARPPREVRRSVPGRTKTLRADDGPPGPRNGLDECWHWSAESGALTLAVRLDDVGRARVHVVAG